CRRMRLMDCSTPILGMTSFSLNRYRVPLAAAGAQGLVEKDETQFEQGVSRVLSGCSLAGFETPMAAYAKLKCDVEMESTLTNMQETIMDLCVNEYLTDGEIAGRLGISIATVRKHMQNIVKRLNCRTQRQAIITWLKRGNGR
ncbi:response regulator transcription factor, partial [Bifidobacterium sp.]|uniref:response regulator transcription factor n=1 Tax=Bifidobacterium sp. TaxID=41200 RepID=UPI003D7EF271